MKKIALSLALLGSFASADFLSLSAGVGEWNQKVDGYVKVGDTINYFAPHKVDPLNNVGSFGLDSATNPYVWAKFIYPIPLLPNIKAQYTKYDTTGHSDYIAGGDVKIFGDAKIKTGISNADTTQTINSYDATFFYEFKPVVADIEAGFGIDYWQGHTKIYGKASVTGETKTWVDSDWSVLIPYLYGHVETMQLFGFSLIANAKYAKVTDAHHYDYVGAVKYTIDILGPINPFIKAGYRYKDVYGKDGDDETKLQYKGAFLEVGAKF